MVTSKPWAKDLRPNPDKIHYSLTASSVQQYIQCHPVVTTHTHTEVPTNAQKAEEFGPAHTKGGGMELPLMWICRDSCLKIAKQLKIGAERVESGAFFLQRGY